MQLGVLKTGWVVCALVAASAAWAVPGGAVPEEVCRELRGTIETQAVTEGCESPLEVCFAGILRTNSPLRGETYFTLTSLETDPQGQLVYTGELVLFLANGEQVIFESTGVVDPATGAFQETDLGVRDDGSTASLQFEGFALPGLSGFQGTATGRLCRQVPGH